MDTTQFCRVLLNYHHKTSRCQQLNNTQRFIPARRRFVEYSRDQPAKKDTHPRLNNNYCQYPQMDLHNSNRSRKANGSLNYLRALATTTIRTAAMMFVPVCFLRSDQLRRQKKKSTIAAVRNVKPPEAKLMISRSVKALQKTSTPNSTTIELITARSDVVSELQDGKDRIPSQETEHDRIPSVQKHDENQISTYQQKIQDNDYE